MSRLFHPDSGLMKGLSMVGDLMLLNFLFILFCVPAVTAGASAAALYSVTLKIAAKEEGTVVRPFIRAFRKSFLKATAMWLLLLAMGFLVILGIRVINANPEALPWVFNAGYAAAGILLLTVLTWVWPLEARFENSIGRTLKNALLLGLTHPFVTLAALLLTALPAALAVTAPYLFLAGSLIWALFWFSCAALVNSLMFTRVFRPFIIKDRSSEKEPPAGHQPEPPAAKV